MLNRFALPLLLISPAALAFNVDHDATGAAVAWHLPPAFIIDSGLAATLQEPNTNQAIEAAVATYNAFLPDLGISVSVGPTTGVGYVPGGPNENSISAPSEWEFDEDAIAITIVTLDATSHALLDTDIALNVWNHVFRALDAATPASPFDDIQNTVTHELGHSLGMLHNPDETSVVMYPTSPRGQISKRTLTSDDEAGLTYLYSAILKKGGAGCSSVPGAVSFWPLLGLLIWFFRGNLRRVGQVGALGGFLISSAALADSPVALSGTVTFSQTEQPRPGERLLHTYVEIRVEQCLSGARCPSTVAVEVPGGTFGGIEQHVIDAPSPVKGEKLGVILRGEVDGVARAPQASVFHVSEGKELVRFLGKVAALRSRPATANP